MRKSYPILFGPSLAQIKESHYRSEDNDFEKEVFFSWLDDNGHRSRVEVFIQAAERPRKTDELNTWKLRAQCWDLLDEGNRYMSTINVVIRYDVKRRNGRIRFVRDGV